MNIETSDIDRPISTSVLAFWEARKSWNKSETSTECLDDPATVVTSKTIKALFDELYDQYFSALLGKGELPLSANESTTSAEHSVDDAARLIKAGFEKRLPTLRSLAAETFWESGMSNRFVELVEECFSESKEVARSWLCDLVVTYYSNDSFLTSLLRAVAFLPSETAGASVIGITSSLLHHKSIDVKEAAIMAFEAWDTADCYTILENTDFAEGWLKHYVNEILSDRR